MNKLLEIKNRAVKFYGEHQSYLFPIVKFVIAFAAFVTIDLNIGYMTQISSILIALLLALICTIIPINGIIWIGSVMILMDMYALSIERHLYCFLSFTLYISVLRLRMRLQWCLHRYASVLIFRM